MRTTVYLRQSQDRSGEELGVSRQREDAYRLAEVRGWTVVRTITDNDTSASGRKARSGFEELLLAIAAGDTDAVIAWDMSRLSRNRKDTVRLLEVGEQRGVTLAFVRGTDLDLSTPAGQLTADVLAGVARHEIKQKSDRQRRAVAQAAEAGRWVGGRRPFGFDDDGVTIRDAEAEALRWAYDAVLSGVSLGAVAREWNGRGLLTPQKTRRGEPSRWTSQTVRPTLLNPRYAGWRAVGRKREIVSVAQWSAIVPDSTWRATVAIITDSVRATPPRSGTSLLTGVATCAVCDEPGAPVHAGAARSRQGRPGWRTYRCTRSLGHVCRAADPVDQYVTDVVVERLGRSDAADLLVDHNRADVDQLRAELRALHGRRRSLVGLVADGTFTEAEVRRQAEQLAELIAATETALADAGRVDILGPLVSADNVRAAWDALDTERQRAVISTLITVRLHPPGRGTRTFRPETVEINWKT